MWISWYNLFKLSYIPHITSPTRLTSRSHTLIDNITSNVITEDAISGNIINTISDHLGQFLILPCHYIISNSKQEILQRKSIFSR